MQTIKAQEFGGERPLYTLHDAELENVTIHPGESGIKESGNIVATRCTFNGKYVFWECNGFRVTDSLFQAGARSSLWYSRNGEILRCRVEAPKMFRRMSGIIIKDSIFTDAQETMWDCANVQLENSEMHAADYLAMHLDGGRFSNFHLEGNYAFQYAKRVEIRNSLLNSKDSLWESEDVTVYDSEINGEYLGWYSKNLHLVRCHITGEQPLCYCEGLVMEDCTMGDDANLAFEYSTIHASLRGRVHSIKNPTAGQIDVDEVGEIIWDANQKAPADCKINVRHAV